MASIKQKLFILGFVTVAGLVVIAALLAALNGKSFSDDIGAVATGPSYGISGHREDMLGVREEVILSVGESKEIGDIAITVTEVSSDSRCPIDAVCMQAGKVVVAVVLVSGETSQSASLSFPGMAFSFEGYRISIKDIKPIRISGNTPANTDYRITFLVEEK
jgi:hypothetical protein